MFEPHLWIGACLLKLFLLNSYTSTDFEVHRHWIALTNRLPLREWYTETHSVWTLDYPPFFAYFEYLLGRIAAVVLPVASKERLFTLSAEPQVDAAILLFQRCSVILSEVVYWHAAYLYTLSRSIRAPVESRVTFVALVMTPGLLFVDHMHFQYNGLLYGLLLYSIHFIIHGMNFLAAAFFTTLLHFKHLYVYLALPYFIFLFRKHQTWRGVATLGAIVLGISALSLFPFLPQYKEVLGRLFPFKRGLMHALPAANVWVLYTTMDRVLAKCLHVPTEAVFARGLVTDMPMAVLPNVTPLHTMILTLLVQLPILWRLWRCPSREQFFASLILCGLTAFLFGWHVHEKAIMMATVPMTFLLLVDAQTCDTILMLITAGYTALLPLLPRPQETAVKLIYLATYVLSLYIIRNIYFRAEKRVSINAYFGRYSSLAAYLLGALLVQLYAIVVHPFCLAHRWPQLAFTPILFTVLYSAIGIFCAFTQWYVALYDSTFIRAK